MKLGFTTLAVFMKENNEIIDLARKHDFGIIEILGEEMILEKDNHEFMDCGLDIRIHSPTVDINIASLNKGIRKESVQIINCANIAEDLNASAITVHPGIIGRNEPHLREQAMLFSIESIGEIIDNSNVAISVENMPVRGKFLGNTVEEIERIQEEGNLEEMLNLKKISYCHLNDNDGKKDQHIALGDGTMDLKLLKKIDTAIIELNNFDNILKSQEVIRKLGLI